MQKRLLRLKKAVEKRSAKSNTIEEFYRLNNLSNRIEVLERRKGNTRSKRLKVRVPT